MAFPRVLVISPIRFNQQTGSGVTMSNLFRGWPRDAIAQIHSDDFTESDHTVCNRYLYLPPLPIERPRSLRAVVLNLIEFISFVTGWQMPLRALLFMKEALKWSRQFSPDLIYTRPSEQTILHCWLPRQLAKEFGIPYVTRILDDWPARYEERQGLTNKFFRKPLLRKRLQALFDEAAINLGISVEMCSAYKERYGVRFVPFHNCIDIEEWAHLEKSYQVEGEFCIAYVGAVTEDKELGSLIDIRNAVLSLRQEGHLVRLQIYGPELYEGTIEKYLAHPPGVVYGGSFHHEEKTAVLSRADLLILPINFDSYSLAYVGYSFQTKVPEYMASGTPVLVYGPPTSPNVRYASRDGWGLVVDQPDTGRIEEAIIRLMEDSSLRAELGRRARDLAFRNHNGKKVRRSFRRLMSEVAFGSLSAGQDNELR